MLSASHPAPPAPRRSSRRCPALVAFALAACSALPPAHYPRFADHELTAAYVVGEDGRLWFPATSRDVVVGALQLDPPPLGERFGDGGQRWFVYPRGTEVTARCRLRVYAAAGAPPTLEALLPGAVITPH